MRKGTAWRVAFTGMLFALAIVLSIAESWLTPLLGLPPGVKLGLANCVVMFALYYTSRWQALLLVLLKAGFGLITRGAVAGLLSLTGGLASLGVMLLLLLPKRKPGVVLVSVAGAIFHNLGQFVVVWWLYGPPAAYYLPVLLVAGLVMGVLTAVLLRVLLPALEKTGLTRKDATPDSPED
ncbi:MAG: Gx transporter family protein [Ruminococcaceae bacterium]|nr:Gx transporter family protein [Oscillospiraceae bacterium]